LNIINFEVFKYYFVRVTIIMMLKTGGIMIENIFLRFCELGDIVKRADENTFEDEIALFLKSLGLIEYSEEGYKLTKLGEHFLNYSPLKEEPGLKC